jgi:divalent metal cation (Fe/Co/Zn/Cd) transporter
VSTRPGWRLAAALYPFGAGAAAVNVFFASLIGSWLGGPVVSPYQAVAVGLVLGAPATWIFAQHLTRLMQRADEQSRKQVDDIHPGAGGLRKLAPVELMKSEHATSSCP